MARTIFGPQGEPISVIGGTPLSTEQALKRLDKDAFEDEIAKTVRSQAVSLSQVWDPSRGKPKPTSVTYRTLRMMAQRNEWVRAIIKTRKAQIGRTDWSILPVDEDDDSPAVNKLCRKIENLLRRPSLHGSRVYQRSWRQFIGEYLEDILTIDAGCIEKERTADRWIAALYPVDGATIMPNIDEQGGYHDDAYVQVVDGQVTARFGMEDLIYTMDNPQTDVRFAGYGFSPLESLIVSVTAELYASKYNASYFEKGAVPEGLLNLGPEVSPEDVNAFRLYWMNEVMGRPWAIPIVGGGSAEWVPWRASNKDMEYMAYQQWLLKKICAVYQIPPQEVGELEDVNRSTAQDQSEINRTKSEGPVLRLIEDEIEVSIIGELGLGVQDYVRFTFDPEEDDEGCALVKWGALVDKGAATRNEMRVALGEDAGDDPGLDLYLVAGEVAPLPESPEQAREIALPPRPDGKGDEEAAELPFIGEPEKTIDKAHPQLDEIEDGMGDMWDVAEADLRRELEDILHIPLATANEPVGA